LNNAVLGDYLSSKVLSYLISYLTLRALHLSKNKLQKPINIYDSEWVLSLANHEVLSSIIQQKKTP